MALTPEAKELRKIAHREWQRNNREKTRQYQENYWNKKAAEMKLQSAKQN